MEYVDGPTVYEQIQKHKRIKEKVSIEIVKQVAKALKHAHQRGFIHRDIKPKNVMITKAGVVKLADLGLARGITDVEAAKAEAGRAYGTPYYISPEQIRGDLDIGPSADLYGLGATFYHMITGRVPFEGKNPSAVMHMHLKAAAEPPDHVNPEISAGCAQIIEMMMAKRVDDRYRDVDDLIEDLELVSHGKAPHFAHRSLDHAAITDAITDAVEAPSTIRTQPRTPRVNPLQSSRLVTGLLIWALLPPGGDPERRVGAIESAPWSSTSIPRTSTRSGGRRPSGCSTASRRTRAWSRRRASSSTRASGRSATSSRGR
jgi:serine/threonine protein kinase